MNDSKNQKDKNKSLVDSLFVPVLVALIAGGTSPWWISSLPGNGEVSKPITSTNTESADPSQVLEGPQNNISVNNNPVNSQSKSDQALVNGTGNNVVQGAGNQLTIQQEPDAKSRGEFEVPAISGLSYHNARKILVKEGWIPLTQRHFHSQQELSLQHGSGKVFWSLGYWEIVFCSGTAEGFCRFEFSDPSGRKLVVITAGMEDPSIPVQAHVNRVSFDKGNSP